MMLARILLAGTSVAILLAFDVLVRLRGAG